jgi:hypothetical protein
MMTELTVLNENITKTQKKRVHLFKMNKPTLDEISSPHPTAVLPSTQSYIFS